MLLPAGLFGTFPNELLYRVLAEKLQCSKLQNSLDPSTLVLDPFFVQSWADIRLWAKNTFAKTEVFSQHADAD